MGRKTSIIIFPTLNDRGGDLSRKWYVEWKYQIPGEPEKRIERVYKGLATGTNAERRKIANAIIDEKTEWLKSGEYLSGSLKKVYEDELMYRNEAKIYGKYKSNVITSRTYLSEFLSMKKQTFKNPKSYMDFQSKLRIFNVWLEKNKLDQLSIKLIKRQHIIDFSKYLSEDENLSRLTIDKYIQCISAFFENELLNQRIESNPVLKIPKMGKIVDCSAVPFHNNDREKLKNAISNVDPQLWLACQIEYYCAIRPGTELRLMKIKWIDFDKKCFRIPNIEAKNSLTEIVVIPDQLMSEMIKMNLQTYHFDLYLFGKNGCPGTIPLGKNTLRNKFNRYRDALNISTEYKFYSWKHTGAIQLLENGVKEHDLQNHLRHKSYTTTEVYLKKKTPQRNSTVNQFTSDI